MRLPVLVLPVLLFLGTGAGAKAEAPRVHRVEKLTEHAYAIFGPGGNVGLLVGERHAVLVDGQFERSAPGLLETVRGITDKPIRYLVNTHHHPDHVGANAFFARQGAILVAHTHARARLAKAQAALEPGKRGGLPEVLAGDMDPAGLSRLDLHPEGLELHLAHRGSAHTDGDLMVGFPAELVLHMGDVFFHGMLPYIDAGGGGRFEGLLAQVEWLLTWVPDGMRIIPGHGPVCGKPELARYRDLLRAVQAHGKAHPDRSPAELALTFPVKDWADYPPTEGFVTWETLFRVAGGKGSGRVETP